MSAHDVLHRSNFLLRQLGEMGFSFARRDLAAVTQAYLDEQVRRTIRKLDDILDRSSRLSKAKDELEL